MASTDEWIEKAEADARGATALARRRKLPLADLVCFHCQQCIEKYLKALLLFHGGLPPRIHDLLELLRLVGQKDPTVGSYRSDAVRLGSFAVLVRYPGASATPSDAKAAMTSMRRLRRALRRRLGL
ncbi:MAG: HEPN domain-containing protein [Planctomycetes bacterium]|nr:HEPN domain-containing protein [Planctomycetota bacterium]